MCEKRNGGGHVTVSVCNLCGDNNVNFFFGRSVL